MKTKTKRHIYIGASNKGQLHVAVHRDQEKLGKLYYPGKASLGRLEKLIHKLNCPPHITLNDQGVFLLYDATRRQKRPANSMPLGVGRGGRA